MHNHNADQASGSGLDRQAGQSDLRSAAAQSLEQDITTRSARCGVIGLGFIGSTLMDALSAAGYEVHGFDRLPAAVERYQRGRAESDIETSRPWSVSSDESSLKEVDIIFVAVRLPVHDGSIDTEPLCSAANVLGRRHLSPRLIIVESTVPPGMTRQFAAWLSPNVSIPTTFVVHAPERLSAGHDWKIFRRTPHLVGGLDAISTRVASCLFGQLCTEVVPVSAPEVSEVSKLLENGFLSVGIALIGEVTKLAQRLNISAREVSEAAATKPFGYFPFYPGPGVGGHCLPNDLQILASAIATNDCEALLLEAAKLVLAEQPGLVVERLSTLLAEKHGSLPGAQILLVGVGFKPGSADTTASPAQSITRLLRKRGAMVFYLDTKVPAFDVDGEEVPRVHPDSVRENAFEAGVLLAGDGTIDPDRLIRSCGFLLDAGGGRVMQMTPTLAAHLSRDPTILQL